MLLGSDRIDPPALEAALGGVEAEGPDTAIAAPLTCSLPLINATCSTSLSALPVLSSHLRETSDAMNPAPYLGALGGWSE